MPEGPVLGLDLGDVRVGMAISDPDRRVAVPLETVSAEDAERAVARTVLERGARVVVVGLPLSMSGERGTRAEAAAAFAKKLEDSLGISVVLQDERLSTVEAERALAAAGARGRERRRRVDTAAATVILQAWLDASR